MGVASGRASLYNCSRTTVTLWQSKTSATITKSLFPKHSTRSGPRHFQSKLGHWATRHRHLLFNFEPQLREETFLFTLPLHKVLLAHFTQFILKRTTLTVFIFNYTNSRAYQGVI